MMDLESSAKIFVCNLSDLCSSFKFRVLTQILNSALFTSSKTLTGKGGNSLRNELSIIYLKLFVWMVGIT